MNDYQQWIEDEADLHRRDLDRERRERFLPRTSKEIADGLKANRAASQGSVPGDEH